MSLTATYAPLAAVVGLALYFFGPGKWSEVGRVLLFVGLLASLLFWGRSGVHL